MWGPHKSLLPPPFLPFLSLSHRFFLFSRRRAREARAAAAGRRAGEGWSCAGRRRKRRTSVPVVVAGEGDAGGGIGARLRVAGVEDGDRLPDEEKDGLILGDGGEADLVVEVVGVEVVGDAEDLGEVAEGLVKLGGGLVEGLAGVFEDAAGGALEEVGVDSLAEEGGEALN
uniref:Uncharacterized protein n=1 Tax=Oryza rufipogon TaxID=4529 RepID=A0A0E0R9K3_ORYRU